MKTKFPKRICAFFCCCLVLIRLDAVTVCAETDEPKELYALSACLMDGRTGRVLYEKNGLEKRANASTTKIMTCILALELGDLEDEVVISARAQRQPQVKLHVKEGERFRMRDLLYAMMLESDNDAAVAIAEHIGGSVETFAELMNKKAEQIGCEQTHFITPNGLDDTDHEGFHGTTAVDLAKILSYCITTSPKAQEFLQLTQTQDHTFSDLDQKRQFNCNNHNTLLHQMSDAITGKTGFTSDAGYCYVGAVENNGRLFVVSLLGCGWPNNKNYKWRDCAKLFAYGKEHYESIDFLPEGDRICLRVDGGLATSQNPFDQAEITVRESGQNASQLLLRDDESIRYSQEIPKMIAAPVYEGMELGRRKYYICDSDGEKELLTITAFTADTDMSEKNAGDYLKYLTKEIFC